jgi:hypothetical protein
MPEPQYPERTYQIVGTIPDTKYSDLREDAPPMAFAPAAQLPVTADGPGAALMIASSNGPSAIAGIQHAIEAKYPNAVLQFFDFRQGIRDNLVGDRMTAMPSSFCRCDQVLSGFEMTVIDRATQWLLPIFKCGVDRWRETDFLVSI